MAMLPSPRIPAPEAADAARPKPTRWPPPFAPAPEGADPDVLPGVAFVVQRRNLCTALSKLLEKGNESEAVRLKTESNLLDVTRVHLHEGRM